MHIKIICYLVDDVKNVEIKLSFLIKPFVYLSGLLKSDYIEDFCKITMETTVTEMFIVKFVGCCSAALLLENNSVIDVIMWFL